MANDEKKSPDASPLAGPAAVTLRAVSQRGPFSRNAASRNAASLNAASLAVPQTRICVVNTSASPVEIAHLSLDPLQLPETGANVEASLSVDAAKTNLAPGESVQLTISGFVPAMPAVYCSTLRVAQREGAPLAIPINFHVAARAGWGVACMVFGLLLVALLNVLDGESGIQGELGAARLARQTAREMLLRTPAPQSRASQVENIEREFAAAIAALQLPREFSFADRRSADAQAHLKSANELTADLRKTLSGQKRGAAEVTDITEEWLSLQTHFSALSKEFLAPAPQGNSLAERLGAFDAWAAERLMRPALAFFAGEFPQDIVRIQLLQASGRGDESAVAATAVRRRLQRAADTINAQARQLRLFSQQSANDLVTAAKIRQRAAASDIAPDKRAAILKSLDETASLLSGPFDFEKRKTVTLGIRKTRSQMLEAAIGAVNAAVDAAVAEEEKVYSIASIQTVLDDGSKLERGADGKIKDPKEKVAFLKRLVEAWRTRLVTLPNPDPPPLRGKLDALEAASAAGDFDAAGQRLSELFLQMAAYSSQRAAVSAFRTTAPICLRLRDDISIEAEAKRQTIRFLDGGPGLNKWEAGLDGLARKLNATPDTSDAMAPQCLQEMIGLSNIVFDLSGEIDNAVWNETALSGAAKRDLARAFAAGLTPQALATLLNDVRPLTIEIVTPESDLITGQQIEFRLSNLAPDWGLDVKIAFDFGDGGSSTVTAEDLRRGKLLIHTYAAAGWFEIAATASDADLAGAGRPTQESLGKGVPVKLTIVRSPVSTARELSGMLFNARFGLALLVAGLLYFWRFHAKKTVFGANAFDYAEAFALGFAVSLAINNLPEKLAKLYQFGGSG